MDITQVMTICGAIAILAGLGLVVLQMLADANPGKYASRSLSAKVGPLQFGVRTTFPGLIVLGFGVILLVVAAIVSR